MKLSEARRNEIAFMFILHKAKDDNIRLSPQDIARRMGNTAKDLGIQRHEAAAFAKEVLETLVANVVDKLDAIASEKGESKDS